ncbi:MAG: hypothetical protein COT15_04335 [Candidatus Diapherotrites archaeon CG08_land_8_20_14_0_20_34_12]|nr:MAG: hypothetical protein COT15_04335 [Candidatus Diapherotrites archaeon CG08_land_8_20_14_0_20_34_12]
MANLTVKISADSDVLQELEDLVNEQNLNYAFITGGRGKLKDIHIVSHGMDSSISRVTLQGPCEILTINGKIEKVKGRNDVNIRVILKGADGNKAGDGQLVSAKVFDDLELDIRKVETKNIIIG